MRMHGVSGSFGDARRSTALAELRAELALFPHEALIRLEHDLRTAQVLHGSWEGCVLSYRGGARGAARRDRLGRRSNAFTTLWDNGALTAEEVLAAVNAERALRAVQLEPGRARDTSTPGSTLARGPRPSSRSLTVVGKNDHGSRSSCNGRTMS